MDDALDPAFEPEAVRLIRDVDTVRALSDPTRMRILETMVQRMQPPWSVKELAAALAVPQTRLYHHVELLAERDLIRPVERRVVSGIIETRYRVSARSFQLDRALFSAGGDQSREAVHDTLVAVFDTARDEVAAAIDDDLVDPAPNAPDDRRVLLSRGLARLTPARAAELRRRLQALAEEFADDPGADGRAYGVVLAVYPMPLQPTEPSDD